MLTTSPGSNVSSVGVRPLGATLSGSSARCIALFRRSNMAGVYRRPPDGRAPPIPLLPPEMLGLLELDFPLSAPLEPTPPPLYAWLPLEKPPLPLAAVPPPVPLLWPVVALGAEPMPVDLLLAATPPPVPELLPDVAYGAG